MKAEYGSIMNRTDTNAHLNKLRQDNIKISEFVESG